MDNSLREQYSLISDTAERFLLDNYPFSVRQQLITGQSGYSDKHWQQIHDMGWMQLSLPVDCGGLGCGIGFVAQLAREFGRHLFMSPFFTSAVLSAKIIENLADDPMRKKLLGEIADNTSVITAALYEKQSRYDMHNITSGAKQNAGRWILNGEKIALQYGNCANRILVLVRTQGEQTDHSGLTLFCLPSQCEGLKLTHYTAHDGSRLSTLRMRNVEVSENCMIGKAHDALVDGISEAVEFSLAYICAEMTGAMERLMDVTLEYAKTRTQFGQKLSSFQAIQHRLVDMYMRCELARSLSSEAINCLESQQGRERGLVLAASKHEIGRMAIINAEEAVQLHGAMGMMDELPVGHYLKRLFTLNLLFGDPDYHRSRFRQLSK